MARVPLYDGPQVRSNALQPVQQQQIDVSSGMRAASAALGGLADMGDKIVQRDAQTEAWNAHAQIAEDYEKWERETRASAQGSNAKGLTAKVDEWWTKTRDERFNSLSPLAQRAAAKSLSDARLAALRSAGAYENQQLEVGERQALSSRIVTGVSAAAAAGAGRADPLIENLVGEIRAFGKQKGLDVEGQVLQTTTGVHANIINGLVRDGRIKEAEAYFTLKKGEIDGTRHDEIAKTLQVGGAARKAQAFGDEVMAQPGVTLESALAEARKRFEGEDETHALQEVKTRFAEQEAVQAKRTRETTKTAWKQLLEKGSISRVDPIVMRDLMQLAPEEKRQMTDWLDAKRRQAKAEAEGTHDPNEFGRFYSYFRMALDNPAGFSDLDLSKVQPYVSKQQLASLVQMQGGISRGDAKAMNQQRQIKTAIDMAKGAILGAGVDLTPKEGTKQATEYANFMGSLSQALTEAQAAQPDKPLTPDQLRDQAMRLVQNYYEQGSGVAGFFETNKRGYQIPRDSDKSYVTTRFKDIPAAVRADLERTYDAKNPRGAGIYGNSGERAAAIERAYQLGREQGRFK
jgi:hypothetical protein